MLKPKSTILIAEIGVNVDFFSLPLECDELFLSYISNQELKNNILYYN